MNCNGTANCECGCCAGIGVQTPQMVQNRAGLPAISYRVGSWARFRESMLARLSSAEYPSLRGLQTREDDDFTIAFLDATSVVLDILTFYQERLANESYLRTAGQLQSLIELSRLVGYTPAPGIAAACYVAFTLTTAPGRAPNPAAPAIIIPQGTQMQSVPAQGQTPQTFETSADIPAKSDWNALPVERAVPWVPNYGDKSVYLQGTATQLQPGDLILIVGDERRVKSPTDPHWDVRVVSTVRPDNQNNRTYVEWSEGLGGGGAGPAHEYPKFYVFRQRASLFGYNALNPVLLAAETQSSIRGTIESSPNPPIPNDAGEDYSVGENVKVIVDGNDSGVLQITSVDANGAVNAPLAVINAANKYSTTSGAKTQGGKGTGLTVNITCLVNSNDSDWGFHPPASSVIDLDAIYSKLIVAGWIALVHPDKNNTRSPAGFIRLYKINSVATVARFDYSISAKISRIEADTDDHLPEYYKFTRQAIALVQSEEILIAPQPLTYPLYSISIDLQDLRPDLTHATIVAITGKRQKLKVIAPNLPFTLDLDGSAVSLNPGDILTLTDPKPLLKITYDQWSSGSGPVTLNVEDATGRPGTVTTDLIYFLLWPSAKDDPEVSECAAVSQIITVSGPPARTVITLTTPLQNCYERATTTVNANVALATAGQSVSEVMGSGSASAINQTFTLKQSPVTDIQAPTSTGRQSTLDVKVDGVSWKEVANLFQQDPAAQVFATLTDASAKTDVIFGDGVEGATLPSGTNNLLANYRIGSGSATNVSARSLTTLIDRPLGVSGVTNPQAATGGQDAQSIDDVRANAPQTVLTLGRAVSITDYQSYAAIFPGIAKAYAIWIPAGPGRGVFLTVAGVNGSDLTDSPTLDNLAASLRNFGNPLIPITVVSFLETMFAFDADILYDSRYDQPTVKAQVQQILAQSYGFARRDFGQGVSADEIAGIIQSVAGVIAVNISNLKPWRTSTAGDLASQGPFTISQLKDWLTKKVDTPTRPTSPDRICPYLPVPSLTSQPTAAEVLVIDPDPSMVILGVMS